MLDAVFRQDATWGALLTAMLGAGAVAYLIAEFAARLARAVLRSLAGGADTGAQLRGPIVRRPIRITRAVVFAAVLCVLLPPALELAGAGIAVGLELSVLMAWLLGRGSPPTLEPWA